MGSEDWASVCVCVCDTGKDTEDEGEDGESSCACEDDTSIAAGYEGCERAVSVLRALTCLVDRSGPSRFLCRREILIWRAMLISTAVLSMESDSSADTRDEALGFFWTWDFPRVGFWLVEAGGVMAGAAGMGLEADEEIGAATRFPELVEVEDVPSVGADEADVEEEDKDDDVTWLVSGGPM